jgi:hypothetical protein
VVAGDRLRPDEEKGVVVRWGDIEER